MIDYKATEEKRDECIESGKAFIDCYNNIPNLTKTTPYVSPISDEDCNNYIDQIHKDSDEISKELDNVSDSQNSSNESENNLDKTREQLKGITSNVEVIYYMDVSTGKPVATSLNIDLKISEEALKADDYQSISDYAKQILTSGVTFSTTIFDYKMGDGVDKIEVPSETKNIQELVDDLNKESQKSVKL